VTKFKAVDTDFEARIRASFGRQKVMETIGARLERITPGEVRIALPFRQALTQQHGYLHAGILGIIVDSACGYAAYTLMPADSEVLSVEYKINFLAPARGQLFVAVGRVLKPGRTLTVCAGEVQAHTDGSPKRIVAMQSTMICVPK
jgi:uncharacterized protein (TIGR00369 family)